MEAGKPGALACSPSPGKRRSLLLKNIPNVNKELWPLLAYDQEAEALHSFTDRTRPDAFVVLPKGQVEGWARTQSVSSYISRPTTRDEVCEVLALARSRGQTVVLHGGGHSYYDAALNAGGITMNLTSMRRVLDWDPKQGIIRIEPGVTIGELWRATIADGWWPEVVPNTAAATLAGCLSMNVHGTNAWKKGSIGGQVLAIELLLASGELLTITPEHNPDLFNAVIGGLGMIGVITSITLQLQPIQSGILQVRHRSARSLSDMFAIFAEEASSAEYLEGLIDGYAGNASLGRGFVKCARFFDKPDPSSLLPQIQTSSSKRVIVPPELLGQAMRPFLNIGSKVSNRIYFRQKALRGNGSAYRVPLTQFHFRSDDVFWFLRALTPAGTRTIQPFVPAEHAPAVFAELLKRSQQAKLVPYWCCLKQHRADPFLLSCLVDGFSLELSYPVTARHSKKLAMLFAEMMEPVIAAGGRLYLAKDDALDPETYARSMGMHRIKHFLAIKHTYDPEGLFQSGLFQRIFSFAPGESPLHSREL